MQRAALLLIISIAACSGCAGRTTAPAPSPAPVLVPLTPCPAPAVPALPQVDGKSSFDSPANVRTLLDRESIMRRYIAGLRATLACYAHQESGYGME